MIRVYQETTLPLPYSYRSPFGHPFEVLGVPSFSILFLQLRPAVPANSEGPNPVENMADA